MQIQANSAYAAIAAITGGQKMVKNVDSAAASAGSPVLSSTQVTISEAARQLAASQQTTTHPAEESASAELAKVSVDTPEGKQPIDLSTYFSSPATGSQGMPPLMLPTQGNIAALKKYSDSYMPQFLKEHHIPSAPATLSYAQDGSVVLPSDYPYADAFKKALSEDRNFSGTLHTINAFSSHQAEASKLAPFHEAMSKAASEEEARLISERFKYLFNTATNPPSQIQLHFDADGKVSVSADGKAM